LVADDALVGVLALYSREHNGFSDAHQRVIEMVAREIARTLKRASEFETSTRRDAVTGLPNVKQLERFLESMGAEAAATSARFTLLLIDVVDLKQTNALHGRDVGDEVLRHVAHHTAAGLRVADILFRYGSDEFVALLNESSAESGRTVAERIRRDICANSIVLTATHAITVDVAIVAVSAPSDGRSLATLMETARRRTDRASSAKSHTSVL
jgi:diguanylate cyclase (GGDEF)-like protein